MPAPVYLPPHGIDADNLEEFRAAVNAIVERRHGVVVDCSELSYVSLAGMRVLVTAARDGDVTLVNPTPVVRLLASVFGLDVDLGANTHSQHPVFTSRTEPVVRMLRDDASGRGCLADAD